MLKVTTPLSVPLSREEAPTIYVHIPFCSHICPYCDFNTYSGQNDLIPEYIDAIVEEMQITAKMVETFAAVPTLFIGGGTPSLLSAQHVERTIAASIDLLGLSRDAEVTLEANPESVDHSYLEELLQAGVNRLSLGVQSQRRAGLQVLGRGHRALQAGDAFRAARSAGFENISLDFIFGWPGQTPDDWEADLATILDWEPEHVSLYSLIFESGTPMELAVRRGILQSVDDDTVADYYERASEVLDSAGWTHYEIANWAREDCFRSLHNQHYWQNGRYYGIGAGAHSYLNGLRGSNILLPAEYIATIKSGRRPLASAETIDPATEMSETMMLGLRLLIDGVSAADFKHRHGVSLDERYGSQLSHFEELGLLEWIGDRIRLTHTGALVSNSILAEFLA